MSRCRPQESYEAQARMVKVHAALDNIGVVDFDKRADDAKRCETQVLERSRLADSVEKWIQEERDVRVQKEGPGLWMRSDTLQKRQRVAHTVGCLRC